MLDLRFLLLGTTTTVMLSIAVLAVSSILGLALAFARLSAPVPVRLALGGSVAVIPGVPLLVLLIGSYFSLPYLGIDLPLYSVAVVVMGLYFAAYMTEAFRGAILAVPRGQWEAARSLGLRWWQTAGLVVLPQAWRPARGPYLNIALSVVKNTSLVSAIGGWELAAAGREMGDRTGDLLPAYLAVAAGYFLICLPLPRLAARLDASDKAPALRS